MVQSTAANVIRECLNIFEDHFCQKWVNFRRNIDEENAVKEYFFEKYGIPGVIGCVDGTHVRIKSPGSDNHLLYLNRKRFYSLNVIAICDHNMVITFVDARHPGANHDSFVWNSCVPDASRNSRFAGTAVFPINKPYGTSCKNLQIVKHLERN
ncbi:uncharacterized protein LOC118756491 isoform X1 [Rhagoletis pomonella]|uniref:uncharacterized protein LOC118756491 isoform X1 n=1 Tax=Rhagoletis pomonella TaxID=28610 RepID=UPI00177B587E|nr:uncharacterized protein LOC118756491 isoform X1 [Rhagoletis pomonella]